MSIYTDTRDGVLEWTKRPDLVGEMNAAIRQAVRTAHNAGAFWRDLISLPLTGQDTTEAVQVIDLSAAAPGFKQLAYIGPTDSDLRYTPVGVLDLMDEYKAYKTDVCWGLGTSLNIRPAAAAEDLTMVYYAYPTISPIASLDSWICVNNPDLIICWAAASVLAMIGEKEVQARAEGVARAEYAALIAENTLIERR